MNTSIKIKSVLIVAILFLAMTVLAVAPLRHASAYGGTSMIVVERDTGRVLYESNARVARPIASTTKILTAITVIENTPDLDRLVKVPAKAVGVEGSSIYLESGEEVSIRDLLYGLMLQSGNDCAAALAIVVGTSQEGFAKMMNDTAAEAGAKNSNFVNPHGLHDDKHLCSAYDLALISAYAMRNHEFRTISATKVYKDMPYGGRDYNRVIHNKNRLLSSYEGATGIKTGFTKKAGRCLVSSANRDGFEVIAVVLNCGPMFEECARLMTKAFGEYDNAFLCVMGQAIGMGTTASGVTVELYARKSVRYPLTKVEQSRVVTKVNLLETDGKYDTEQVVAEFIYSLDGFVVGKAIGYSREAVSKIVEIVPMPLTQ